jgi:hypothetical protein
MSRRAFPFLVAGFLAVIARVAPCDPVSAAARARAEDAFVGGRPQDVDAAIGASTDPDDAALIALRDLCWRPTPERTHDAKGSGLAGRRVAWLLREQRDRRDGRTPPTGFPTPGPGETDAYPRVTALLQERLARERDGGDGLPESSPAWATGDPALRGFIDDYARDAWRTGPPSPGATPPDAPGAALRALGRRNTVVASVVLGLFLLASFLALRWAERGLRSGPAAADVGKGGPEVPRRSSSFTPRSPP